VKLKIAWVGKTKEPAIQSLTDEYLKRLGRYTQVEGVTLKDEAALTGLGGRVARPHTSQTLVLLDSSGKQFS
jgi:23S rRNA pseudoU1915 N3-methylase RlmH